MTLLEQNALGTVLLAGCVLLHMGSIAFCAGLLRRLGGVVSDTEGSIARLAAIFTTGTFVLLTAHGAQIWIWAAVFLSLGIVGDWEAATYFSAVTYTTLGYGDVVAGTEHRVLATFAAMTGLFTFGVTTAVLLAIALRTLPSLMSGDDDRS